MVPSVAIHTHELPIYQELEVLSREDLL
jgi:hypothetical protein